MITPAFAPAHAGKEVRVRRGIYARIKRPLDVVLALIGLGLGAPLVAAAAVLVKLTSRGPVFYSQVRVGLGGKPFVIYKVRSMYQNCEAVTGACWSKKGDPRVTTVGRFLRWSHIDELPQMLNILFGDMSLIGPRPERPEMVPELAIALPRYRERLHIRPGLTGLAQVQLPPDTDLNSVRIKLAHDLCYLERCTLGLDCRIFLATIFHVLRVPYKLTRALLGLPSGEVVEQQSEPDVVDAAAEVTPVPDLQTA